MGEDQDVLFGAADSFPRYNLSDRVTLLIRNFGSRADGSMSTPRRALPSSSGTPMIRVFLIRMKLQAGSLYFPVFCYFANAVWISFSLLPDTDRFRFTNPKRPWRKAAMQTARAHTLFPSRLKWQ